MPNDPSTLLDILAGLPDPADYDAICVAVMASERGRRFLTEYASRNRHADTRVLVGAIARVEAALRGEPSPHGSETQAGEFTDVAAAIDGIAAEIATNKAPPPDTFAALERIQDIAFVLHERPVEQTLCDALDAALRDVSDALVQSARALEGTHQAAEQLPALANRVRAMNAGSAPAAPIPNNAPVQSSAWAQPIELAAGDGEAFGDAVTTPASFLSAAGPVEVGDAESDSADAVSAPSATAIIDDISALAESERGVPADARGGRGDFLTDPTLFASGEYVSVDYENSEQAFDGAANFRMVGVTALSEEILDDALKTEHFGARDLPSTGATNGEASSDTPIDQSFDEAVREAAQSDDLLPSQNYFLGAVASSREVPGEAFEPLPIPSPLGASSVAAEPSADAAVATEPPPVMPLPAAAPLALTAVPRPAPGDPLAAVRALSEEELIALFG